jgi:hypothetical protein
MGEDVFSVPDDDFGRLAIRKLKLLDGLEKSKRDFLATKQLLNKIKNRSKRMTIV